MKITQAEFSGSSQQLSDRPKKKAAEFAFIGRSNVGKSSLINCLCGRKNLARISSTPGKTRLINHFLINDTWYLVDLPGYGYARMSKSAAAKMDKMISHYIINSEELVLLFVLIDSRHDLQKLDLDFLISLGKAEIPFSIIFTKCDKLKPKTLENQIESIKKDLLTYWEALPPMFLSSAEKGTGRDNILDYIDSVLSNI
ncbi:MAG: ribosome biogenesis GTP-binding protein YihA/YsxC [Bacteroidales bacterium]